MRKERKKVKFTTNPKYQIGDRVHVFLTWGAFSETASLQAKDIIFLAEGTVTKVLERDYYIRIDKKILDVKQNLFPIGEVSLFTFLWVERGEEAWNLWNNPSNRFAKVE
jgi:hypothetical protein